MFLSYPETLTYLYENLPVFHRVGSAAYKKDIRNTVILCEILGNPQRKFKSIHVAGTNGKGSSSHMLASVLQTCGYVTGLYTSPHLKDFTERVKINGREIEQQFVVDFVNRIKPLIDEIQPSFFEITVAMAFDYFARRNVDVAVVEVGLGGRLDSTNVITPELSLITNIGWDHKDLLGDTLEKIAIEKAGIIKAGKPVVVSERQAGPDDIFIARAAECRSPVYFASDDFFLTERFVDGKMLFEVRHKGDIIFRDLYIPLQGYYQKKNLTGVLKAAEVLDNDNWGITAEGLREGLCKVVEQTGLKGRWQKLGDRPLIVCDTGHNVDGIREVVNQIRAQTFEKLHIVFGIVRDKDPDEVLEVLPKDAFYYFCEARIPRAMSAQHLADNARAKGLHGVVVSDVNAALRAAKSNASGNDMIFIGGSTYVVAELENL
jgi:dihydrofolate synthase / folylpolyglutamate synthase